MASDRTSSATHLRSILLALGFAIAVTVMAGFVGCERGSSSPTSQRIASMHASIFGSGEATGCPNACIPKSLSMIAATLGLDPEVDYTADTFDLHRFLRDLEHSAEREGGKLTSVSLADCLSRLAAKPGGLGVLLDRGGHLYLLVGALRVDGQYLYQTIHGDARVALLSKAEILSSGVAEAWLIENHVSSVPVRVGTNTLRLDKLYHNFGEVMPDSTLKCAFAVTNDGGVGLVIDNVHTSCGCTTTSADGPLVIAPGEQQSIETTISPTNAESVRQYVTFTVNDPASGASRDVVLSLIGSQRVMKDVLPNSINFGTVATGHTYTRTVTLSETAADRFSLTKIDVGELPLTCTREEATDVRGLRSYKLRCELKCKDIPSGKHGGVLRLHTDSRFGAEVSVPVAFEVPPLVSAVPSVLAVGDFPIGETREYKIDLISSIELTASDITVAEVPDGVKVSVVSDSGKPKLLVTVALTVAGIWQGVIKATIRHGARTEPIEVLCGGIAKDR